MRAVVDHHVDRPEVEAEQSAQLTGTNRSTGLSVRAQRQGSQAPSAAILREDTRNSLRTFSPNSAKGGPARPGGHSEGQNTRSHPELGRENPQRRWYCVSRRGRVGRRQALQALPHQPGSIDAGWSSPVARQAHNLKVEGSNPSPATIQKPGSRKAAGLFLPFGGLVRRVARVPGAPPRVPILRRLGRAGARASARPTSNRTRPHRPTRSARCRGNRAYPRRSRGIAGLSRTTSSRSPIQTARKALQRRSSLPENVKRRA